MSRKWFSFRKQREPLGEQIFHQLKFGEPELPQVENLLESENDGVSWHPGGLQEARQMNIEWRLYDQARDLLEANGEGPQYRQKIPKLLEENDQLKQFAHADLEEDGYDQGMRNEIMRMTGPAILLFREHTERIYCKELASGYENTRTEESHCFAEAMHRTREDLQKIDDAIVALRKQQRRGGSGGYGGRG